MKSCPRDQSALVQKSLGNFSVEACDQCHGLWLPPVWVHTVVSTLPGTSTLPESALLCPSDGTILKLARHKGVEIDVCAECAGLWLDKGELEKLRPAKRSQGEGVVDTVAELGVNGVDAIFNGLDVIEIGVEGGKILLEFLGDAFSSV